MGVLKMSKIPVDHVLLDLAILSKPKTSHVAARKIWILMLKINVVLNKVAVLQKKTEKKETLEFAEKEIVEAERKFETETLAKREKEAQKIVIDAQIKEVEAETAVLETKVAALEADKVVLETKIAAIEAETVELATEVAAIELVAGTLQNDLTQIAADKYDLEATEANLHVEEMELAFEATAIADTLATIETAAAKLDADLIAVNAEISAAADPTAKQAEKNTVVAAIAAKAIEKAAEVDKK